MNVFILVRLMKGIEDKRYGKRQARRQSGRIVECAGCSDCSGYGVGGGYQQFAPLVNAPNGLKETEAFYGVKKLFLAD